MGCKIYLSLSSILILCFSTESVLAAGKETWGYVQVRPGASMFWWLYNANVSLNLYTDYPLIIWLQGGPGDSSTGFGNFYEFGPLDIDLKIRENSWFNKANLLFIDNPVGSGFSYVKNESLLCKDNLQIGKDLLVTIKDFLEKLTEFQKVPIYIFSESYGGKMAIQFALELQKSIAAGHVKSSFKGVVLGGPWISPVDSISSWGPFLHSFSFVDNFGKQQLMESAGVVKKAIANGNFTQAGMLWEYVKGNVINLTHGISFNNVQYPITQKNLESDLVQNGFIGNYLNNFDTKKLTKLMNTTIRDKLKVIPNEISWGGQREKVFSALRGDLMKSVTDVIETLLNTTTVPITIYTGQYDLITNYLGTSAWVENLNWPGKVQFQSAPRESFSVNNSIRIYRKKFKNLSFYSILKAGHMVPIDTPQASFSLLDLIFKKE